MEVNTERLERRHQALNHTRLNGRWLRVQLWVQLWVQLCPNTPPGTPLDSQIHADFEELFNGTIEGCRNLPRAGIWTVLMRADMFLSCLRHCSSGPTVR